MMFERFVIRYVAVFLICSALVFGRIPIINKIAKKKSSFGHKKVLSSTKLMDLSISISSLSANVYPNKFMVGAQIF